MVDLVKIRKKAKEKKDKVQGSGLGAQEEPAAPPEPSEPPPTPAATAAVAAVEAAAPPPPSKLTKFLETAGQTHAVDVVREESGVAQVELLTFVIAGEQYALDIEHVAEIVTPRPVTRVPNTDSSIVGIFSLRGSIVTLVDVRGRLGHGKAGEPGPETRVVVVRQESENIGFVVDRVLRVVKIDVTAVAPQPVAHATEEDESVRGVFQQGGALTILLDLEKLVHGTHV